MNNMSYCILLLFYCSLLYSSLSNGARFILNICIYWSDKWPGQRCVYELYLHALTRLPDDGISYFVARAFLIVVWSCRISVINSPVCPVSLCYLVSFKWAYRKICKFRGIRVTALSGKYLGELVSSIQVTGCISGMSSTTKPRSL